MASLVCGDSGERRAGKSTLDNVVFLLLKKIPRIIWEVLAEGGCSREVNHVNKVIVGENYDIFIKQLIV